LKSELAEVEKLQQVVDCIEYSKNFQDKYQNYDIEIYDVSKNREQILDKIVDDVKVKFCLKF